MAPLGKRGSMRMFGKAFIAIGAVVGIGAYAMGSFSGSNARVVSPAAVVKDMKEDSARMSARYATD